MKGSREATGVRLYLLAKIRTNTGMHARAQSYARAHTNKQTRKHVPDRAHHLRLLKYCYINASSGKQWVVHILENLTAEVIKPIVHYDSLNWDFIVIYLFIYSCIYFAQMRRFFPNKQITAGVAANAALVCLTVYIQV